MKKLLIITNVDWFLISHRLILAQAAVKSGWKVYVACEDTGRGGEIGGDGIEFIPFSMSRSGINPVAEWNLLRRLNRLYKKIQPDVVHHITIKPVVYGSLAANRQGIRGVVNAISGMGYMFSQGKVGIMQKSILSLMRRGAKRSNLTFIFQNEEDHAILRDYEVIDPENKVEMIKGSGVDLDHFSFTEPPKGNKITILLPCRMLWDKGVRELREASDFLKDKYQSQIQFVLVGMADYENKSGVPESFLHEWADGEYVVWKGHQSDMVAHYQLADIVVLPSYREGLPKSLIEACAVGRPIVTTDAIGCRDCVDEGVNGFKVPVGDGLALAKALEKLITDLDLRQRMGSAGRKKAEAEFDVREVVQKHLDIYQSFL